MIPGPNKLLRIPSSGALVKIATIMTGNTFGARFWTDGKREAPMLPEQPWLRCHPGDRQMFWTDECEEVAVERDEKYRHVPYTGEPTLQEYRQGLHSAMITTSLEKERYIRIRLWWAANDLVRHGETIVQSSPRTIATICRSYVCYST